mgnify:CR=1 FL=1
MFLEMSRFLPEHYGAYPQFGFHHAKGPDNPKDFVFQAPNLTLPQEFGGQGYTLNQYTREARRLARHAPATALCLNMHHLATDGWSCGVLSRELGLLYDGLEHGTTELAPSGWWISMGRRSSVDSCADADRPSVRRRRRHAGTGTSRTTSGPPNSSNCTARIITGPGCTRSTGRPASSRQPPWRAGRRKVFRRNGHP